MLDELVDTIEALKKRVNDHGPALQASEAQTRYSLIDPLLRALGWDTANPAMVKPEVVLSTGRADYALLGTNQRPVAIVEAKKLNEPLGNVEMQLLPYAFASDVGYAVLTDGNHWVVYKTFRQNQDDPRDMLDVTIANKPAHECALSLLLLWHPNMASGQPIRASEPIAETENPEPTPPKPDPIVPPSLGWITLKELEVQADRSHPPRVRFPNGAEKVVTSWKGMLIEIAEWLIDTEVLTEARCPLTIGRNPTNYTINSQPVHRDGTKMFQPSTLSNGLSLAAHGSATAVLDKCKGILNALGIDPATVHLQVG